MANIVEQIIELDNEIRNCNECGEFVEKFFNLTTVSFGDNSIDTKKLLLVGESPAKHGWRESGVAWHTAENDLISSGKVMQKLLDKIDRDLMETYFIEAIKCYVKDKKNLKECSCNCKKFLNAQIEILNPDVVLLLGENSTKSVLEVKFKNFGKMVGKHFYKEINDKNILFIPIYHPSPISPRSYTGNLKTFGELKDILEEESNSFVLERKI